MTNEKASPPSGIMQTVFSCVPLMLVFAVCAEHFMRSWYPTFTYTAKIHSINSVFI